MRLTYPVRHAVGFIGRPQAGSERGAGVRKHEKNSSLRVGAILVFYFLSRSISDEVTSATEQRRLACNFFRSCNLSRTRFGVEWTSTEAQVSEVFVRIGDHVTITDGPLAGLIGRLASLAEQRAVVIVHVRGRQVEVEMELDWVATTAPQRKLVTRLRESAIQRRRSDPA